LVTARIVVAFAALLGGASAPSIEISARARSMQPGEVVVLSIIAPVV
jgi:hypothetical protein